MAKSLVLQNENQRFSNQIDFCDNRFFFFFSQRSRYLCKEYAYAIIYLSLKRKKNALIAMN